MKSDSGRAALHDALERFADAADSAGERSLFLCRAWFDNFLEKIPRDGDRLYEFSTAVEDRRALLLAWVRADSSDKTKLAALSNYYSSLFGPIVDYGSPGAPEALRKLVDRIVDDENRWSVVDLKPLDNEGMTLPAMQAAFRARGWLTQTYFCFGNWYLPVDGTSFESYLANRPKVIRKNVPRLCRRFAEMPGARMEIVTEPDQLSKALDGYWSVYSRRWSRPEPYPEFIEGLAATCAERGWLRLGLAWIDQKPVAAQFWIVRERVAYIFKVAYDPEFKRESVGSVLTMKMMERAIDEETVEEVDFLTGDDSYKRDWMTHRRERWGLIAFNPRRIRGLAAAVRALGSQQLKRLLGRLPMLRKVVGK